MPKYKGVIHEEFEFEAPDKESFMSTVKLWVSSLHGSLTPTISEIPAHQGKQIIGYDCTACDRDIVPMYDAGKMMCPWCRGVDYVKTIYEE